MPICFARSIVLALLFIPISHSNAKAFEVAVARVIDGDTLTLVDRNGKTTRARLYGIDAPERKQPFGRQAKSVLLSLLPQGRILDVEIVDMDRQGRPIVLAKIQEDKTLNESLVENGHAWVDQRYCAREFCQDWKKLERQAKKQKIGLWQEHSPMPPWEWRTLRKTK